jgi:hypothetical protein
MTKPTFALLLGAALGISSAFAQTCATTDVNGTYGFVALFTGVSVAPPGTTAGPAGTIPGPVFSNSQLGKLLGNVSGSSAASLAGQLYFDGAGGVWVSSAPGGNNVLAGAYTVNSDCTIQITLRDALSAVPPRSSTSLVGVLANAGTELYLAYAPAVSTETGASGGTAPGSAPPRLSTRSAIHLIRVNNQTACSASTLRGAYTLIGMGSGFAAPDSSQGAGTSTPPSTFIARVRFDGAGTLTADPVTSSPLAMFQYTGTYTVNADCTGTMTLQQASPTAPGATTPATTSGSASSSPSGWAASFVITGPITQVNGAGVVAFQNIYGLRPSLIFAISNGTQTVNGHGAAE